MLSLDAGLCPKIALIFFWRISIPSVPDDCYCQGLFYISFGAFDMIRINLITKRRNHGNNCTINSVTQIQHVYNDNALISVPANDANVKVDRLAHAQIVPGKRAEYAWLFTHKNFQPNRTRTGPSSPPFGGLGSVQFGTVPGTVVPFRLAFFLANRTRTGPSTVDFSQCKWGLRQ